MNARRISFLAVGAALGFYIAFSNSLADSPRRPHPPHGRPPFDLLVRQHAQMMLEEGRNTFRYDTFGDEAFWGGALRLHEAIEGEAHGGVGDGLSPREALELGLKVDVEALPPSVVLALETGQVDLDDPNVTLELLRLNAVVGVTGFPDGEGGLQSVGIQCALCHSVVDNSLAPGIGRRLDGWANRDLNVGAIVALAPDLTPFTQLLGVDEATVRNVLHSWGPGKFDAELILDGKAFRPDGKSAATLIPPAFGLAGVNLHTWTGWGSVTHWNAFVANLEMGGKGTFFDPRLDDAAQFPIAAANRFGHVTNHPDLITSKLPALHFYQLAIPAPAPPRGSFDEAAATRGDDLFTGKAKCATCHTDELFTEPGWNMHTGEEIGIDNFQADRSPDRRYRTSPLRGLWTHMKGGFYHDGRFATLLDVVNHYQTVFGLGLSESEKNDLVEYLKSLGGKVESNVADATTLNAVYEPAPENAVASETWKVTVQPSPMIRGNSVRVRLEGVVPRGTPTDLSTEIFDIHGRRIARVRDWAMDAGRHTATAVWDGKNAHGNAAASGVYFVRVSAPSVGYRVDRKIVLR